MTLAPKALQPRSLPCESRGSDVRCSPAEWLLSTSAGQQQATTRNKLSTKVPWTGQCAQKQWQIRTLLVYKCQQVHEWANNAQQQSTQNCKVAHVYLTWQTLIHILPFSRVAQSPTAENRHAHLRKQSSENISQQRPVWTEGEAHTCAAKIIAPNLIPRKQSSSTACLSYRAVLCCFLKILNNSLTDGD